MIRVAAFLAVFVVFASAGPARDLPAESSATLERKLVGSWKGPACGGNYTFRADGTYDMTHYTPGNHTLSGRWSVRWDALPPTLVLTCLKSDEAEYVGKTRELKLVKLSDKSFSYDVGDPKWMPTFERVTKE